MWPSLTFLGGTNDLGLFGALYLGQVASLKGNSLAITEPLGQCTVYRSPSLRARGRACSIWKHSGCPPQLAILRQCLLVFPLGWRTVHPTTESPGLAGYPPRLGSQLSCLMTRWSHAMGDPKTRLLMYSLPKPSSLTPTAHSSLCICHL